MFTCYHDREEAGVRLGEALRPEYAGRTDVAVLALPRGGVPVAREVARLLGAPLDVLVVRKLGVPGHEELAMGAIGSGGAVYLDRKLVHALGVSPAQIEFTLERERRELRRRESLYGRGGSAPDVTGRTVLLVDDGIATGATMTAAVQAVRAKGAARVVVAAPVGSEEGCAALGDVADEVICLASPSPFCAIGPWYDDFGQVSDDEVRRCLEESGDDRGAALPHGA